MHEIPVRSFAVSVVAVRRNDEQSEVLLLKRTSSLRGEWCQVAGQRNVLRHVEAEFLLREPSRHLEIKIS